MNKQQLEFIKLASQWLSETDRDTITRQEIIDLIERKDMKYPAWFVNDSQYRVSRGTYRLPKLENTPEGTPEPTLNLVQTAPVEPCVAAVISEKSPAPKSEFIPDVNPNYVPFGVYEDVYTTIKSRRFIPTYITGHSGNGKTLSIVQACAKLGRECFLVNISAETDEDDLLGGLRIADGKTYLHYGPVAEAMRRGAVLILDEVDYGSEKLSCLQRVLEGREIILKKTTECIRPAPGFQVFATGNTKGKGSESGRYANTRILNEAFLDRYSQMMEQNYPTEDIEIQILNKLGQSYGVQDKDFSKKLVTWANATRLSFFESTRNEMISTRRLCDIVGLFAVYKSRQRAIELGTNRFEGNVATAFRDLYAKLDASIDTSNLKKSAKATETSYVLDSSALIN